MEALAYLLTSNRFKDDLRTTKDFKRTRPDMFPFCNVDEEFVTHLLRVENGRHSVRCSLEVDRRRIHIFPFRISLAYSTSSRLLGVYSKTVGALYVSDL